MAFHGYIWHKVLFKNETETREWRDETCRIGSGTIQEVSKGRENEGDKGYLHEQTTARQQVFRN